MLPSLFEREQVDDIRGFELFDPELAALKGDAEGEA